MTVENDRVLELATLDAKEILCEMPGVFHAFRAMLKLAPSNHEIIAPQYAEARKKVLHDYELEFAYEKFLIELCWSYSDIEDFFRTPGNESEFVVFAARAGKAGLNVEKFLDALLAIAFFDSTVNGSSHPLVFHRFVSAEYIAMPERFAARQARQQHAKKLRVKAILAECGLAPEVLFKLLGTGFGAERGVVMEGIYEVIRWKSKGEQFGVHAKHIRECAANAHAKLAAEGLSV